MKALSTTDIWAVGSYTDSDTLEHVLVEHSTDGGETWTHDTSSFTGVGRLTAIDGSSSGDVWAVGWVYNGTTNRYEPLTLKLVSGHLTQQINISLDSSKNYFLTSVAERTSTDIWAVGYTQSNVGYVTFTMHYGTGGWAEESSPNLHNPPCGFSGCFEYLYGVTFAGLSDVWAVGISGTNSNSIHPQTSMLIHWNGSSWDSTPLTVTMDNLWYSSLFGVTATSSQNIWAVGSYNLQNSGGAGPLVWHSADGGSTWNQVPAEDPGGTSFYGITKDADSGNMWAVGSRNYIQSSTQHVDTVIEHYTPGTIPPSITVNPTQGSSGTSVAVTGSNWTPGDVVDVSLSTSVSVLTKATVAGNGTISMSFTIPQNATTGLQFVNAQDETTGQTAKAPFTVTRKQLLFVLLQGIDTGLSQNDVDANEGLGMIPDFVKTNNNIAGIVPMLKLRFPNAQFLAFSYGGSNPFDGHPLQYNCLDTFVHSIDFDALELSIQIAGYLKTQPKDTVTDIYLIGHSLGGTVALAYLTGFLKVPDKVISLPANGHLAGVITLDSPVGGVSSNKGFLNFIFSKVYKENAKGLLGCFGLKDYKTQFTSVMNLANLYDTSSQPTFPPPDDGNNGSQGAHASILKAIFNGPALTNQELVEEAASKGISILTIGNLLDYLYNPGACLSGLPNFLTAQWVGDEGPLDSTLEGHPSLAVYGREFVAGVKICIPNSLLNLVNHMVVYNNSDVETALLQFLPNGGEPNSLTIAPPEP